MGLVFPFTTGEFSIFVILKFGSIAIACFYRGATAFFLLVKASEFTVQQLDEDCLGVE
jgi:hypothetical protein